MPPRRDNTQPENVAEEVAQQLRDAIPNLVAQITAGVTATQQTTQTGPAGSTAQGCSYKTFMTCKPKEFNGTEGAVGLLSWFESMESVLHISKCAENNKVEYSACQLQGRALTWWNTQVQTRGREAVYQLTWTEFKKLLTDEYCTKDSIQKLETEFWGHSMVGSDIESYTARFHELAKLVPHLVTPEDKRIDRYLWGLHKEVRDTVTSSNPKTIQEAVIMANRLTTNAVRTGTITGDTEAGKRKQEDTSKGKEEDKSDEKPKRARNYASTTQEPKKYWGKHPMCNRCNFHHSGNCPVCFKCNQTGHSAKYCQVGNPPRPNTGNQGGPA